MTKLLANENVAAAVVVALRADGHDVTWIKEVGRGSTDDVVLALAHAENRVLLTFDLPGLSEMPRVGGNDP